MFVATQSLSWTLFVAVVLCALHAARAIGAGLLHLSPHLLAALAVAPAAAMFGLSASALAFVDGAATKRIASYASGLRRGLRSPSDDALVATVDAQVTAAGVATHRRVCAVKAATSSAPAGSREDSGQQACAARVPAAEVKGVRTTRAAVQWAHRCAASKLWPVMHHSTVQRRGSVLPDRVNSNAMVCVS